MSTLCAWRHGGFSLSDRTTTGGWGRREYSWIRLRTDSGLHPRPDQTHTVHHPAHSGGCEFALPTPTDENRIWESGRLRLFLSHVSRIKAQTSALKAALRALGIDGFVAHEDIEPAFEWHREIEFGLRSMHALCALVITHARSIFNANGSLAAPTLLAAALIRTATRGSIPKKAAARSKTSVVELNSSHELFDDIWWREPDSNRR